MSGAPTAAPAPSPFLPVAPVDPSKRPDVQPAGPNVEAGDSFAPAGSLPGLGADVKGPLPPGPPGAAPAAAGDVPGPLPTAPPAGPSTITVTEGKDTATGLDPASAARTTADIDAASGAARAASAGDAAFQHFQAQRGMERSASLLAGAATDLEKQAAEQATLDHIEEATDKKLAAGADWRPDRAELFGGDQGVAFGLTAAVAAMAGAWMQGRGISRDNPYLPSIMKMIDDNVADQVRRNSGVMQHLRDVKGDTKAAMLDLKGRHLATVKQQLEALALKDQSEIMAAGVGAAKLKVEAEIAKTELEQRKALNRSVTKETSRRVMANPALAQAGQFNEGKYKAGMQVRQLDRTIETLKRASQSGAWAAVAGWQDKLGANSFQEFFGGLPPEQKQVVQALTDLETLQRASWKSEPNGQAVQARLSQVNIPQNDRDIPVALQRLEAMREDAALGLKGAAISDDTDPTAGAF